MKIMHGINNQRLIMGMHLLGDLAKHHPVHLMDHRTNRLMLVCKHHSIYSIILLVHRIIVSIQVITQLLATCLVDYLT